MKYLVPPRFMAIIKDSAEGHGVTVEDLLGNPNGRGVSQRKVVSQARTMAIQRMLGLGLSISDTARYLRVHHTTVLYRKMDGIRIDCDVPIKIPIPDLSGEWAI